MRKFIIFIFPLILCCNTQQNTIFEPANYTLELYRAVFLKGSQNVNASGITFDKSGKFYIIDDKGPGPASWEKNRPVLYSLDPGFLSEADSENIHLEPADSAIVSENFAQAAKAAGKMHLFDFEGICCKGDGKFLAVDERDRGIFELDIKNGTVVPVATHNQLLDGLDFLLDAKLNNGFEGIATNERTLYLAQEMFPSAILVYNWDSDSISHEKTITLEQNIDVTGLSFFENHLYALGRTASRVFKLDPQSGEVISTADFKNFADSLVFRYNNNMPFYRNSEGITIDKRFIYIVLDGNGKSLADGSGRRETLMFVFKKPDGF